jgi:hypothetical protein
MVDWYISAFLGPVLNSSTCSEIAFAYTWRNSAPDSYWVPLPGQDAYPGFKRFSQSSSTIFAGDPVLRSLMPLVHASADKQTQMQTWSTSGAPGVENQSLATVGLVTSSPHNNTNLPQYSMDTVPLFAHCGPSNKTAFGNDFEALYKELSRFSMVTVLHMHCTVHVNICHRTVGDP